MLGRAKNIKVEKKIQQLLMELVKRAALKKRTAQIKAQIGESTSDYDKKSFRRLAKLAVVFDN